MKKYLPKFLVTIATCLVTAPGWALVEKPQQPGDVPDVSFRYPVVAAPLLPAEPVIDGTVGQMEWGAAAQTTPFVALTSGIAAEEPATSWIGYTQDALYIAFHFERPPSALEPLAGTDPMHVWRDDAVELFLRPEFGARWEYNFVGNAAGVHEEGRRAGNTDKGWNADWKYTARRTPTGWEGEMAIPFKSLGVATPAPGTAWEMNLMSNRKSPRGELAAWAFMKQWSSLEDFGYLVFGGQIPAVRVLQAGELSRDEVGVLLEVSNFTGKDTTLAVQTSLYQPQKVGVGFFATVDVAANPLGAQAEVKEQIPANTVVAEALQQYQTLKQEKQEVVVPANQSRRILLTQPSARGAYVVQYQVRDPQSGMLLAAGPLPFNRRAPLEIEATPFILSAGAVQVTTDYRKVPGVQEGDLLTVQWRDEAGEKVLQEKSAPIDLKGQQTTFDVPVKELAAGRYQIVARITGSGQERSERRQEFNLPAIPEWWGNSIGKPEATDTVPEPWTPMRKVADGFEVWNRKMTLGDALQPAQITSGSTPMLARPATLDMKAAGLVLSPLEVTKEQKTGISYRQAVRGQGFSGELLLESEFDGFMKYTLRLNPQGTANLDRLVLEIPIKPELATHYRHGHIGTPVNQSEVDGTYGYGAMKENLSLAFTDTVWLGNDEMGFEWCAESDQWWTPENPKQAVQIERTQDATILRINLVNTPRALSQPVQFQWAILPTPVKPMNEELLHDLRLAQSGWSLNDQQTGLKENTDKFIDALVDADVNAYHQFGWGPESPLAVFSPDGWSAPYYRLTETDKLRQQAYREANEIAYKKGIKWSIAYTIFSSVFPDWPNVGELWKEQAQYPYSPSLRGTYMFCPAEPFTDWYISELRKMIETTKINGVYLDSSPDPRICAQPHHGHGYTDEQGQRHGTYPVFQNRELHKRIYTLFHGEMTTGGLVYAHNSHFPFMAVESFADVHHCGEGSDLNRDYLIPKFYGRPFGLPVTFTRWNNPLYPEKRMHSWRVVLQLDSTIKAHPAYVVSREANKIYPDAVDSLGRERVVNGYDEDSLVVYKIWQAQKNFPYDESQWIPFWKAAPYAQTGDEDLLPAIHVAPGKEALIVVSSFKEDPTTLNLKLDWKKLGFDWQKVRLVDSITDEVLESTSEGVTLEVLDNRWRMFSIKPIP